MVWNDSSYGFLVVTSIWVRVGRHRMGCGIRRCCQCRLAVSEASLRSWLTGKSSVIEEIGLEVNTEKIKCVVQRERQH